MKYFVTKYALSSGIKEVDAEVSPVSEKMIVVRGTWLRETYHKPYWHLTKEEAIAHAETMCTAKLASLQKSIDKLKKKKF